jgi:hypothetical protein
MLLIDYMNKCPDFEYLELWENLYSDRRIIERFDKELHKYARHIIEVANFNINTADITFREIYPYNGYLYNVIILKIEDDIYKISPYYGGSEECHRGRLSIYDSRYDQTEFMDTIDEMKAYIKLIY